MNVLSAHGGLDDSVEPAEVPGVQERALILDFNIASWRIEIVFKGFCYSKKRARLPVLINFRAKLKFLCRKNGLCGI